MKISPQRIKEIVAAVVQFRADLSLLHTQGEGKNGCVGWPECDCRLAEEIRIVVHMENEWNYRLREEKAI